MTPTPPEAEAALDALLFEPSDQATCRQIKAGVIGAGVMGGAHAAALLGGEALAPVALADSDVKKAEAVGAELGLSGCSVEELLSSEAELIIAAVPTGLHADVAERVFGAGKHLLLEKPLDLSLKQADRIIRLAHESGRMLSVGGQRRFASANQFTHQAIAAGWLGKVHLATVEVPISRTPDYFTSAPWRGKPDLDGGIMINQGIHTIDLVLWHCGRPQEVAGLYTAYSATVEVSGTSVAIARLDSGTLLSIAGTSRTHNSQPPRYALYGDQGSIIVDNDEVVHFVSDTSEATPPSTVETNQEQLILQHADVARALQEGREPTITGEQARDALMVALVAEGRER